MSKMVANAGELDKLTEQNWQVKFSEQLYLR